MERLRVKTGKFPSYRGYLVLLHVNKVGTNTFASKIRGCDGESYKKINLINEGCVGAYSRMSVRIKTNARLFCISIREKLPKRIRQSHGGMKNMTQTTNT